MLLSTSQTLNYADLPGNWLSSCNRFFRSHFWRWSGFGPGWICSVLVLCLLTRGSGSVSPRKMSRKQPIEDSQLIMYLINFTFFRVFLSDHLFLCRQRPNTARHSGWAFRKGTVRIFPQQPKCGRDNTEFSSTRTS